MSDELMEKFADNEHERWSRWHKYARANWTPERVARWDFLADLPYAELTEELKQKDRDEVMPYWKEIERKDAEINKLKNMVLVGPLKEEYLAMKKEIARLTDRIKDMEHDRDFNSRTYFNMGDEIKRFRKALQIISDANDWPACEYAKEALTGGAE